MHLHKLLQELSWNRMKDGDILENFMISRIWILESCMASGRCWYFGKLYDIGRKYQIGNNKKITYEGEAYATGSSYRRDFRWKIIRTE